MIVRFHGGPYAGRVEDLPASLNPYIQVPMQPSVGITTYDPNGAYPPTSTYRTLVYEIVTYADGSRHAHTPRGLKTLRRNATRKDALHRAYSLAQLGDAEGARRALAPLVGAGK